MVFRSPLGTLRTPCRAGETIQRITTAKNATSQDFQAWLRHKDVSSDVYIGMNTLRHDVGLYRKTVGANTP